MIHFDNSYARLPEGFFARVAPSPVAMPKLIAFNSDLAERLGLDQEWLTGSDGVAMLAGNLVPSGAEPLAQAYAGHQFGGFSPQLGDGRAVLLGEIIAPDQARFDLQLKGSGRTPFSRMGDGRAWLGPVLREYLVSEFMHAMDVPTTRALAAVSTGEIIVRERAYPGAVLTRVAASHIRVGTFQFFAVREQHEALQSLTHYVIDRHYPDAKTPLDLLDAVVARQADTIAQWMALGFIHGVMNTDNMAISGETIDYGPCAFMDGFNADKVFSSIDQTGRYAWSRQPQIAVWNLAQFATCLIPLMGDRDAAIATATEAVQRFAPLYDAAWRRRFGDKLGLSAENPNLRPLTEQLLSIMQAQSADFTRVFAGLADGTAQNEFAHPQEFLVWQESWEAEQPSVEAMKQANPLRIPRNHRIEEAIVAAVGGDFVPFRHLLDGISKPRMTGAQWEDLQLAPRPDQLVHRTFCGT